MNLVSEINSTGLYATVGKNYIYEDASGNDAVEPISALRNKQDALLFNGDNNKITAINNSAIGGTEYTAGIDLKIDNGIISVNANNCTTNNTGYTFAIGNGSTANGTNTVAIGLTTSAAGNQTFAGGTRTSANGNQTFAIGSYTSAGGEQSFAGGLNTTADGNQTFVYGLNLNSVTDNNFVIGKYNDVTTYSADPIFIIGNGTTSTNSNAFVVYSDGYVTAQGDLGVTFASGNEIYSYDVGHTLTELSDGSTNWNNTYTTVNSNSSTWNTALTGVNVDNNPLTVTNNTVNIVLTGKVDKVTGKGLSTNDYDDAASAIVANASAVIPSDATDQNKLVSNSTMQAAIANVGHFEIVPLSQDDEPSVQNPNTKIFYLTRPSSADPTDPYTEWIYTSSSPSDTAWNVIGSTQIDLQGYAKLPSTYTEDHIIAFGSNDTVKDTGVTTAQIGGTITGITINGGSEITPVNKVVNLPAATNTNNVGTDGIMAGADKVKLDNIPTTYTTANDYLSLSTANQTITYGLNVTTGTYSNTNVITQIGGSGLSAFIADSANSAANSNKLNGQLASYYCTETTAKKLSDYAGGNGIVVAGDVYTTKSIASNLTEVPLQDGTGIHVDVVTGGNNDYVSISVKPEILLYQTTAPLTANLDSQIAFNIASNYTAYNTKSNNGTLGVANASITGLDASKMYNYNIKASVVATAAENVALKGPNWNNNYSWTSAYVNGNGTLELDCYIKGETSIEVSSYRSGVAEIGIIEASVTEVCDV